MLQPISSPLAAKLFLQFFMANQFTEMVDPMREENLMAVFELINWDLLTQTSTVQPSTSDANQGAAQSFNLL